MHEIPPPSASAAAADAAATRAAFRLVFPGVMVAMFLAAADQTILASALPSIAAEQGALADLSWVVVGYLLAATVAAPLYGYLGDRYGRRRMLLMALGVFTAASVACVFAPSFFWLVLFRALQGLGGGGLMTLAQALIGEHVSPRERGRFAGYFATVFALASTSGPVLGAYLTEHFGWRSVFVVNVPLGLLAAMLAVRIPTPPATSAPRVHALDVPGAVLFSIATTCLLFALTSGGHRFAWWSWQLIALLGIAVVGFVLLFAWERRHPDPVLPVRLLAMPAIARSDAVVMCFAAVMFPFILYLPLYLQLGRGMGIGASGASLLPVTLAQVVTSALTGRLVTLTGRVTIFPKVGLTVATGALLALAASAGSGAGSVPLPAFMALTMAVGIGLGMVMPPTQVTVQMAAGRDKLGVATGLISLSRAMGGAVGVALAGAMLFALIDAPADSAATVLHRALEGGAGTLTAMPEALRAELGMRIGGAYRAVFVLLAVFAAIGAAVAWTIPPSDWKR